MNESYLLALTDMYAEGSAVVVRCNGCMFVWRYTEPTGLDKATSLALDHARQKHEPGLARIASADNKYSVRSGQ